MEVNTMNIKNQIKAQIMVAGFTMAEVVDALSTEYGWSDSLSNFSAKLSRESLRYKEALELARCWDTKSYGRRKEMPNYESTTRYFEICQVQRPHSEPDRSA